MESGRAGFTLIEMSIVLVIIGLIVGGVLVGQDLIRAAYVRAQLSQIEKYNTAVNTFYGKYQALPGDMNASVAVANGFTPRGQYAGEGDGNGIIEGISADLPNANFGVSEGGGETLMFWVDLTIANGLNLNLIEGSFGAASPTVLHSATPAAGINMYLPIAKLGAGNFVYVWSFNGINYYGISAVLDMGYLCGACTHSVPAMTVGQAYSIDRKIDDGYPQSGRVLAMYLNQNGSGINWPAGNSTGYDTYGAPYTTATLGSGSTCFDNGNATGATQQYSMEIGGGSARNCALSFQFQGGD